MNYFINELPQFNVKVTTDYGNIRLYWETPENIKGSESYQVFVQGRNDGEYEDLYNTMILSGYLNGNDYVGYACQEKGFYKELRFVLVALSDREPVAVYYGDPFDPHAFFPEKETLLIGEDVRTEDIDSFSWNCSGTTAESNYSYFVNKEDNGITITRQTTDNTKTRSISNRKWARLIDYLKEGTIIRKHVMDPEIEILDGSSERMIISWKGITDVESNSYIFCADGQLKKEIERYLKSLISPRILAVSIAMGGLASVIVFGRRLLKTK